MTEGFPLPIPPEATVGNRFVLSTANVTQLCTENLQERSGGQEPDPQTGFSRGNQA